MKFILDVMGCDNPNNLIDGIPLALNENKDVYLIACGDSSLIEQGLKSANFDRSRLEIVNTTEVITDNDFPVSAVRSKKDSSLDVAYRFLKTREDVSVMISAGSMGAVIAGAVLILGRNNRQDRPTLATFLPTDNDGIVCLADCGANVDSRPEHLLQFAYYSCEYLSKVLNVQNPRVGLLSIGTEEQKGNALTKEAFALLKNSDLNFLGNVEAQNVLSGDYDVVVSDGFSGNVFLKTIEATTKSILSKLLAFKKFSQDCVKTKECLDELKKHLLGKMDFNSLGGALLLGAKKPVIKLRGSATAQTVVNTIRQAISMVQSGLTI